MNTNTKITDKKGKKPLFSGVATALITPFRDDAIDYPSLTSLIDFQIENGVSAIVLLGTTGEAPTVTETERERMLCAAAERINGRVPLIVGTGTISTAVSMRYTNFAATHGADAVLVVTPYYNKGTEKGTVTHYKKISQIMPTIVYNVPSRTGVDITLSQLESLLSEENIIGIKEASQSIDKSTKIIAEFGDRYALYSGNDSMTLPVLSVGGRGVISVISNIIPREMSELCNEFFIGNAEKSRELQLRYFRLIQLLFKETTPAPINYAASLLGLCENSLRLPMSAVESTTSAEIEKEMKRLSIVK